MNKINLSEMAQYATKCKEADCSPLVSPDELIALLRVAQYSKLFLSQKSAPALQYTRDKLLASLDLIEFDVSENEMKTILESLKHECLVHGGL